MAPTMAGYGADLQMELTTSPMIGAGDQDDATEDSTMSDIKTRFAGGYEVNPALVGQGIMRRRGLVMGARQQRGGARGRTAGRAARGRERRTGPGPPRPRPRRSRRGRGRALAAPPGRRPTSLSARPRGARSPRRR